MKSKIIPIILLCVTILLFTGSAVAQNAALYFLKPNDVILPVGNNVDLTIHWTDTYGNEQNGTTAFLTGTLPEWSINGKPAATAGKSEGSIFSGLKTADAVYTAPDKIPPVNPVTVAVKFKANDTSKQEVTLLCNIKIVDPGQNWYFTFSGTKSSLETIKSSSREFQKRENASGNTSMLIDAALPQNGYVIINTEQGDKVISSAVGGSYSYYESDIQKAADGTTEEKTLRNYSGTPDKNSQGLLFEYNAADKTDQQGIQGAGISFNVTGTDEFWKPDVNWKLQKHTSPFSQKNFAGIGAGHTEDKVIKIKNGFTIDFSQSKDTTYTDFKGTHTIKTMEQYHAQLTRVNKK